MTIRLYQCIVVGFWLLRGCSGRRTQKQDPHNIFLRDTNDPSSPSKIKIKSSAVNGNATDYKTASPSQIKIESSAVNGNATNYKGANKKDSTNVKMASTKSNCDSVTSTEKLSKATKNGKGDDKGKTVPPRPMASTSPSPYLHPSTGAISATPSTAATTNGPILAPASRPTTAQPTTLGPTTIGPFAAPGSPTSVPTTAAAPVGTLVPSATVPPSTFPSGPTAIPTTASAPIGNPSATLPPSTFPSGPTAGPTTVSAPIGTLNPSATLPPSTLPSDPTAVPTTAPTPTTVTQPPITSAPSTSEPSTASPTVPLAPRFDITLDFDSSVPTADQADYQVAASRWEQIVTGDLEDVDSSTIVAPPEKSCTYPATIDDLFICIYYEQLQTGVAGQGGFTYLRQSDGLPAAGFARFDPDEIVNGKQQGWFASVVLHEIGHVLGIGTSGFCPSNGNSKANLEYQAISKCSTNIPTEQPACFHYDESCLDTELMTPIVAPDSPLSRITIAWLEVLGYKVDYTTADPFGSNLLGSVAGCNCNRRHMSETADRPRHVRHVGVIGKPYTDDRRTQQQEELSEEGYKNAVESGRTYLKEQGEKYEEEGDAEEVAGLTFVGDKLVWVYYVENNSVHSVLVQQ